MIVYIHDSLGAKLDALSKPIMIELDFDKQGGLIPAVAQDHVSGEVLMLAYMNRESLDLTLKTGIVHYWSRSRKELWKKGGTSGNIQELVELRIDCDGDAVLLKVRQIGDAACHTGYRSCFYRIYDGNTVRIDGKKIHDPT